MAKNVIKLPQGTERPDRPTPPIGVTATTAVVSIRAFLAWLPPKLRPEIVAARTAKLMVWEGRPAAVREWKALEAEFYAVLATRKIHGAGVVKAFAAWSSEIGKLGTIAKSREIAAREDFSFLGDHEPGRQDLLDTRNG